MKWHDASEELPNKDGWYVIIHKNGCAKMHVSVGEDGVPDEAKNNMRAFGLEYWIEAPQEDVL